MREASEKYNSLGYFHFARGLGMLIIIFGHSMNPFVSQEAPTDAPALFSGAGSILGGGIMAMFFMMSGFGFYTRSARKCLSIQSKLLLKPYCLSAIAILITKAVLAVIKQRPLLKHGGELFLTYLLGLNAEGGGTLGGIPIDSISIFWFILSLFGGWILYNGIQRLKSKKLQTCLILLCVVLSWALTLISSIWPFCLPIALLSVGYLAAGHKIRELNLLDRRLPFWCWLCLLLIAAVSAAFGRVNMVACAWQLGLIDVAGSFCVGFILLRLYARFMDLDLHGKVIRLTESIGFYSIWILCIHGYEKAIFPWYRLAEVFPNSPAACIAVCFLCRCLIIFLFLALLSFLSRRMSRLRRKKPLGKNNAKA